MMAPIRRSSQLLGSVAYAIVYGLIHTAAMLVVLCLFFGLDLAMRTWGGRGDDAIGSVSFVGIGMLAAILPLLYVERGAQMTFVLQSVLLLVSGVYYPISILPEWMRVLAHLSPATYILDGVRAALIEGVPGPAPGRRLATRGHGHRPHPGRRVGLRRAERTPSGPASSSGWAEMERHPRPDRTHADARGIAGRPVPALPRHRRRHPRDGGGEPGVAAGGRRGGADRRRRDAARRTSTRTQRPVSRHLHHRARRGHRRLCPGGLGRPDRRHPRLLVRDPARPGHPSAGGHPGDPRLDRGPPAGHRGRTRAGRRGSRPTAPPDHRVSRRRHRHDRAPPGAPATVDRRFATLVRPDFDAIAVPPCPTASRSARSPTSRPPAPDLRGRDGRVPRRVQRPRAHGGRLRTVPRRAGPGPLAVVDRLRRRTGRRRRPWLRSGSATTAPGKAGSIPCSLGAAWRRRGLARGLIGRSLVLLRDRGANRAALGADLQSPNQTFTLYESCGFRLASSTTAWRKPLAGPDGDVR